MNGKEQKRLAVYSDSGRVPLHAETVYDPETKECQFAVYDRASQRISYVSTLQWPVDNTTYVPQDGGLGGLLEKGTILLPAKADAYGSETDLRAEIEGFLRTYLVLPDGYYMLVSYYVMLTWIADCFPIMQYLRARGESGAGKSRLLQTVGSISYCPIMASGATTASPVFRLYEMFRRATLVLDEADWDTRNDEFSEIIKILNVGYQKGQAVLRTEKDGSDLQPKAFDCFGPKILATRNAFGDNALESRCLTIKMTPVTLGAVPSNIGARFWRDALAIRNKLLTWRFHKFKIYDEVPELDMTGISNRIRSTAAPLLLLASSATEQAQLRSFLRAFDLEIKETRAMDWDSQVVQCLIECMADQGILPGAGMHIPMSDVLNKVNAKCEAEKDQPLTNRKVFAILRNRMNLSLSRGTGGRFFVTSRPERVKELADHLGIPCNLETGWAPNPEEAPF